MAADSDIPFFVHFERELPEGGVAFSDNPPAVFDATFAKPIAVDASGTPLAVQPLMEWDPDHEEFTVFDSSGAPTSFDPPYYQFPDQYWVHIEVSATPGTGLPTYHPIAVDQSGTPLPTQPLMELDPADPTNLNKVEVHNSSGNLQPWAWEIPKDYSVHIAVSGSPGRMALSYEPVAVDSSGTPLTIQPNIQLDPADPTKVTILDVHGSPISYQPPIYQIPQEYQVHIEVSGTPGSSRSATSYTPVAVDKSGTPLAIQPVMEVDPANPTKVTIYDSTGVPTGYRPPIYEIPNDYQVHLATVGLPGHGALTHYPIAVDSSGTPLTIQPKLELDPADPTKVTVYGLDGSPTSYEPEIYDFPERFTVHLGVSGPPGHGVATYAPVAVDEFGTPLPIQPLMEVDPADPTNITVYDHTGMPTDFQPPIYFDKVLAPYKVEDKSGGLDEEEAATAADDATVAEPDPEAHLDEASSTAPEAGAAPAEEAAPVSDAGASPEGESEAIQLGEHDAGAEQAQGEVGQDSAFNEDLITAGLDEPADPGTPTGRTLEPDEADMEPVDPSEVAKVEVADVDVAAVESPVTAGLDEPMTAESRAAEVAVAEVAEDAIIPIEVSEIEGLVTAGLEPEFEVEDTGEAEFKVEDAVPELKWGDEEPELNWGEPTEEASNNPTPMPTPKLEPIEMTDIPLAEPIEQAVIEPIEIVVEPLETVPIREVTRIEEPDEPDRLAGIDDDEEEEEQIQT